MILEKSKLNLNYEFDKVEEDKKLKLLLKDDFIDDGEDFNLENAPIVLPLVDQGLSMISNLYQLFKYGIAR